jgi:hypothetical protein
MALLLALLQVINACYQQLDVGAQQAVSTQCSTACLQELQSGSQLEDLQSPQLH